MNLKNKLKKDFPDINWDEAVDWNWGEYEIYKHTTSNNPKTYLLQSWDNNIWVYDIIKNSISVIQTYSDMTIKEVKAILN